MYRIMIVEDDAALSNGMMLALKDSNFQFIQAFDLEQGFRGIQNDKPDLIILDLNLPDGNGLKLLGELRKNSRVPVLILTANDLEIDIVTGLELGADDYITKPFSLMVLRARVHTQIRRLNEGETKGDRYVSPPFIFDFDEMQFSKDGSSVELSKTEQRLLKLLVANKGRTLPRTLLVDRLWTGDAQYVDENALSVTIKRLRDKLEGDSSAPQYIRTVYGIGYTWWSEEGEMG